jgi:hypothetical protein
MAAEADLMDLVVEPEVIKPIVELVGNTTMLQPEAAAVAAAVPDMLEIVLVLVALAAAAVAAAVQALVTIIVIPTTTVSVVEKVVTVDMELLAKAQKEATLLVHIKTFLVEMAVELVLVEMLEQANLQQVSLLVLQQILNGQ